MMKLKFKYHKIRLHIFFNGHLKFTECLVSKTFIAGPNSTCKLALTWKPFEKIKIHDSKQASNGPLNRQNYVSSHQSF